VRFEGGGKKMNQEVVSRKESKRCISGKGFEQTGGPTKLGRDQNGKRLKGTLVLLLFIGQTIAHRGEGISSQRLDERDLFGILET